MDVAGPVQTLSFRAIRAIVAVARAGSITEASYHLNVTQPALSRIVHLAEQQLGRKLFERRNDGVSISAIGELLLPRLEQIVLHLETCANEIEAKTGNRNSRFARYVSERHLTSLQAAVEHSDIRKAANMLGRSVSLIYRYLRECQEIAGGPLLQHENQGVKPTPLGLAVLRRTKLCFGELRHADAELAGVMGQPAGTLKVGSLPLSRTFLIPQAIARLKRDYPELTVSLIDGAYSTLLDLLRNGEIDVLIGALRQPAPFADVEEHRLFDDELVAVVRHGHPLTSRKRCRFSDLASFPWIIPRAGTPALGHIRSIFSDAGIAFPKDLVVTNSLVAIRTLLLESDRVTMISRHQVKFELELGVLDVLPLSFEQSNRPIGYTLLSQIAPPPALARLIIMLRDISETLEAPRPRAASRALPGAKKLVLD